MNEQSKIGNSVAAADHLAAERAVTYATEAFLSSACAAAKNKLLWPRVWKQKISNAHRNLAEFMGRGAPVVRG